jgi:transcriptional regulator with XRE-family HTH domain
MTVTVENIIRAVELEEKQKSLVADLGLIFSDIRMEIGLSQREAATLLDTTQARISGAETGDWDPKLSTLIKYAKGYGYDVQVTLLPEE